MTTKGHNVNQLKEQIKNAFQDVSYPGDNHITGPSIAPGTELYDIQQVFKGKHWLDITGNILSTQSDSIFFLSVEGYHFYLPGFMLACIDDFEEMKNIAGQLIHTLTPPKIIYEQRRKWLEDDNRDYTKIIVQESEKYKNIHIRSFKEKMENITLKQKQAIKSFLEFIRDMYPQYFFDEAETALKEYWDKF